MPSSPSAARATPCRARRSHPIAAMRCCSTAACCRPTRAATSISSSPAAPPDTKVPAMSSARPRGVIAATATPVDAAFRPDLPRLVRHCRALLNGGCDAINLLGTTGEATAFSVEQRIAAMRAVAEAGLPLDRFMVGTGVPALEETVRLTRTACELGFAGALVLPPYYYPDVSDAGLIAYV